MNKKDKDKVLKLYEKKKLPQTEVAKLMGISRNTLRRFLIKNKIKRRNISESVNLSYRDRNSWSKGKSKENNASLQSMAVKNSKVRKGKTWEELMGKEKAQIAKEKRRIAMTGKKRKPFSEEHRRKLSLLQLGRKCPKQSLRMKRNNPSQTNEFKEQLSKRMTGKGNNFWNGGVSFSPYTKEFNNRFKRLIRKRDNNICMLCGKHREKLDRALSIHHINYDKKLTIPENCVSLCDSCHGLTHYNRKSWITMFQSLLVERYEYKYNENMEVIKRI